MENGRMYGLGVEEDDGMGRLICKEALLLAVDVSRANSIARLHENTVVSRVLHHSY